MKTDTKVMLSCFAGFILVTLLLIIISTFLPDRPPKYSYDAAVVRCGSEANFQGCMRYLGHPVDNEGYRLDSEGHRLPDQH